MAVFGGNFWGLSLHGGNVWGQVWGNFLGWNVSGGFLLGEENLSGGFMVECPERELSGMGVCIPCRNTTLYVSQLRFRPLRLTHRYTQYTDRQTVFDWPCYKLISISTIINITSITMITAAWQLNNTSDISYFVQCFCYTVIHKHGWWRTSSSHHKLLLHYNCMARVLFEIYRLGQIKWG